jgi:RNA polymerase sigma-70 factor (ECF subfamily)
LGESASLFWLIEDAMTIPDTRSSLILRVKDHADADAWREFNEIYRPVVVRLARSKGLQHADAEDLAQQVMSAVAGAIDRWQPDPERGRFRTWLGTIARNFIINALSRRPIAVAAGHDQAALDGLADAPEDAANTELDLAFRREVFVWAARSIQSEFAADTWGVFWSSAVDGETINEVARKYRKSVGAVYAARSRVMKRLKEKVQSWDGGK